MYGHYDLILNNDDIALLSDFVQLLSVFEVFTTYAQGKNYPTMNSVLLFREEIIQRYSYVFEFKLIAIRNQIQ